MHLVPQRPVGIDLRQILPNAEFPNGDIRFNSCTSDWTECRPGDLYVALQTPEGDGHLQIAEAIQNGAIGVVAERFVPSGVPLCIANDSRQAFGTICHALAGNPSNRLATVGVTGTCGKTVTSMLLASVLENAGQNVGLLSSLGYCDGLDIHPTGDKPLSTVDMAAWLGRMANTGCDSAVVELSSQDLAHRTAAGLSLDAAVLTNVKRDHLDMHGSIVNYRNAKRRMFQLLSPGGFAVVNADDAGSSEILRKLENPTITYGLHAEAEITATIVERFKSEQTFLLHAGSDTIPVRTHMIGDHHVSNCLAAAAVGLVMGMKLTAIAKGLEEVDYIPGRMERIECGQSFGVFVDYARTPDALAACLKAARRVTKGRVICAFGPDGESDRELRPLLGRVAESGSDLPIVTSTNPGDEAPLNIVHDVLDGFDDVSSAHVMPGRAHAVEWALEQARPGDTVILAGMGHLSSHRIADQVIQHDDRLIARSWLQHQAPAKTASKPSLSIFPPLS